MNIGETLYFKVVQTLGTINICGTSKSDLESSNHGASIIKLDEMFNERHQLITRTYQIELYTHGRKQDIDLNDCVFSYLIRCRWEHSYPRSLSCFRTCVEFKGEKIEIVIDTPYQILEDGYIILDIIYAFILISEMKNVEKAKDIWDSFYINSNVSYDSVGDAITQINLVKETFKTIIKKYPFAKPFFEQLMKKKIEATKEALSKIDFLK